MIKLQYAFQISCGDRYYWVKNGEGYFDYLPVKMVHVR